VLSGSENDVEGGELKGGGNGLGVRLAKSATPVSKRKGSFAAPCCDSGRAVDDAKDRG
jgi:hypothetical protein